MDEHELEIERVCQGTRRHDRRRVTGIPDAADDTAQAGQVGADLSGHDDDRDAKAPGQHRGVPAGHGRRSPPQRASDDHERGMARLALERLTLSADDDDAAHAVGERTGDERRRSVGTRLVGPRDHQVPERKAGSGDAADRCSVRAVHHRRRPHAAAPVMKRHRGLDPRRGPWGSLPKGHASMSRCRIA
jgi:hypothetical protein